MPIRAPAALISFSAWLVVLRSNPTRARSSCQILSAIMVDPGAEDECYQAFCVLSQTVVLWRRRDIKLLRLSSQIRFYAVRAGIAPGERGMTEVTSVSYSSKGFCQWWFFNQSSAPPS